MRSLHTRLLLLVLGALLALTVRPMSHDAANGASASIGAAHARSSSPALFAAAASLVAAPRSIDWTIDVAPSLVGHCTIVSRYLRDCALRL